MTQKPTEKLIADVIEAWHAYQSEREAWYSACTDQKAYEKSLVKASSTIHILLRRLGLAR